MGLTKWFCACIALIAAAQANEVKIGYNNAQQCSGMFSRASVGGTINPFIEVAFTQQSEPANVSVVIFEYKDVDNIGVPIAGTDEKLLICDNAALMDELCVMEDRGQFLIDPVARNNSKLTILTKSISLTEPLPMRFDIKHTSYYCVSTLSLDSDTYTGVVEFRNSYGELPAAEYFNLPFYGALAIVYVVIGALWAFQYVQHKAEILPVQNYITVLIGFLSAEMIVIWGYYDYVNLHGYNVGSTVYMVFVALLNAFRNSFSFFMILIVSMGYSVVRPSLGPAMVRARLLAIAHFVFGVVYSITSMAISAETASPWVFLVILPLSATMTILYLWTLNSLQATIKELNERLQTQKALMYKRLWGVVIWSITIVILFILLNTFTLANRSPDFLPQHWKDRFVLDGWLNTLYLTVFGTIVFLWRPTADNRRFAMSEEVRQDDFEMDLNLSDDGSDDEDVSKARNGNQTQIQNSRTSQETPPPSAFDRGHNSAAEASTSRTQKTAEQEGLFAVGDDPFEGDDWNEDSDDDESKYNKDRKQ
ncbi:putative Integral membrane protein [Taphrina deformans PYCC 5710]|uniref:Integral membrane protein n=1 Tax=Taphrina deformans (strain PYCC 5710 / ATCC 11124 / CBS 356.35 / IMI 108563 / JCM 9778 / NBRC 8474) TaxID=1097556 RepID=R4X7Q1_TAPDE|nr:putative Integral membrane protein [Taphrina deformans PYCC 5710]|eukprot:CCG81471.1 putative Integral membrane protein [Taphrina deformans PYCC 5710]